MTDFNDRSKFSMKYNMKDMYTHREVYINARKYSQLFPWKSENEDQSIYFFILKTWKGKIIFFLWSTWFCLFCLFFLKYVFELKWHKIVLE